MTLKKVLLLLPLLPLLAAWGHPEPEVVLGLALDHAQGRQALLAGLEKAAKDDRARLLVADAKDDPAAQRDQVRDLLRRGAQALLVLPCDPAQAAPLVAAAHSAGVKVVSLEHAIPGSGLDYLVAFNGLKAGELEARSLVERQPRGRYVLLEKDSLDGNSRRVREGWLEVLDPLIREGRIRITASRRASSAEDAAVETSQILAAKSGGADAILAGDGETAQGAARALEKAGLAGKVPLAGVGGDLAACRRIARGSQALAVYGPPRELAEEAVYLSAKLARKARQFDCQFTDVDNGGSTVRAVLLTPKVAEAADLESTLARDGLFKKEDIGGK